MKKRLSLVLVTLLIFVLALAGCGVSVGTSGKSEDYKSLFPDKAAELKGAYKTSNLSYKFTVGDYEMLVYVDTSEGHSFEVVSSPAGFDIKDKDGEVVLTARCMEKDKYADYTTHFSNEKKINGRDFFFENGSEGIFACSYMADCGMDYGLYMKAESGKEEDLGLVAFRGNALEGASKDLHFYQGKKNETEPEVSVSTETSVETSTETTTETSTETSTEGSEPEITEDPAGTKNLLSDEVREALESITTDYSKIKWGVVYSVSEDMPGIVISVTPVKVYGEYELIVAITNLYDNDISFSANVEAADKDGNIIGSNFIYESCIGASNTAIETIRCYEGVPDGRIRWTDVEAEESLYKYVPWGGEFRASGNPSAGSVDVSYTIQAVDGSGFGGDDLYLLLLDEDGYVVGYERSSLKDVEDGESLSDTLTVYGDGEDLVRTKGAAMFTNPYVDEY